MTQLSVAILSATGTTRKRTIPAIVQGRLCDIAAIHGRDESKLKAMASEFSIPRVFTDAKEMLEAVRPDFAYIGSPPALHQEQLEVCLKCGIPVLCEKPLALSTNEAAQIAVMVRAYDVPVRVAHHLRHQPGVRELAKFMSEASLGGLRRASMQWSFWLNDKASNATWKLNPQTGGPDAFYDAGIHVVDLMVHLFPQPSLITAIAGPSRFDETSDNVSVLALCGSAVVELNASQSMRFPINELALDFEQGAIRIPHAFGEAAFTEMEIVSEHGTETKQFDSVNPYGEEVSDFIRLLQGEATAGTTVEEAVLATRIIEAITQSYRARSSVELMV